ncbi:MAG: hypothetical protein AB1635_06275 [Acidobacteriota bacterium]
MIRVLTVTRAALASLVLITALAAHAQVAPGLVDPNVAPEKELAGLPHMTPALAAKIVAARPFDSVLALNRLLTAEGLTADQLRAFYGRAFIHVNLNTASAEEILLIPGAGKRMAHEFEEYRPWRSFAQFEKEIGKYVDAKEVARLKQYTFIPLDLNTATEAEFMTIPGVGKRMAHEFEEYRPWKSQAQFQKEIGKYVNEKEVARLWRYLVIR